MADDRTTLLTELQRSYLRLVHSGLTSKEIAQRLGASHHTVNSQIAVAVRVLGARSRSDAAALLVQREQFASYDPSYEPPAVAEAALEPPTSVQDQSHFREGLLLPVPTGGRPLNKLTPLQRILWILGLAAVIALIVGGLISGITAQLEGLGRRF
jgi:DNA-binding CsgD family transcriptional regulator